MSLIATLILLIFGLMLVGFSNWKSRQEYELGEMPLLPYTGLQFIGLVLVFVAAAHLITIYTGQPFKGRMMY